MNRRNFLGAGIGAGASLRGARGQGAKTARPNVLLLFTDEQRYDALGAAGNPVIRTPHLDRLAASGVRFTNACTPSPICMAARMSLISGHQSRLTRYAGNGTLAGPKTRFPTLMDAFNEAGYRTHAIGKMHFSGRHYGLHRHETMEETPQHRVDDDYLMYLKSRGVKKRHPQGLRDLLYLQPQTCDIPVEHAESTWVADRAIQFLRDQQRYRGEQPFFLWTSWIAPHPPFAPCEPYASMYPWRQMPAPVNGARSLASLPSPAWSERARLDGAHQDPDRLRRLKALYYAQITHVDDGVGRIMAELGRLGLAENTAIVFTSDHGEMLGDHGLGHKSTPYEGSMRVPLLVRWPGRTEAGRVCDDPAGLTDLFPTMIDGLGLRYPSNFQRLEGQSLLSKPGGGFAQPRDAFFVEFGTGNKRWVALRSRTHKYVLWAAGGREELFDLAADPEERNNLAPGNRPLAERFRDRVLEWERSRGLEESFAGGRFRTFEEPPVPAREPRTVVINDSKWPERLPADERAGVESYAEAFTRAIRNESSLAPEKLSIAEYKKRGGHSLE
ncbi:MAG TPA: sulfatase-like hydrolase/transferase, partial [Bryobacteraceae bacterium]|nr:sulfatase-like hydrolase/transferase [Bryobacteraceae bacterium]